MNIEELKLLINDLPDDMEIILQKDSEGNGYSPLCDGDTDAIYISETTYSGEVMSTNWTAVQAGMSEEKWSEIKNKPKVLVLYPIN